MRLKIIEGERYVDEMNEEYEDKLLKILKAKDVYSRSDYKTIIETWKTTLENEDQLYIGFYDWIKHRPQELLCDVCDFLKIENGEQYFKETEKMVFKGSTIKMTKRIESALIEKHSDTIDYINHVYGKSHGIEW